MGTKVVFTISLHVAGYVNKKLGKSQDSNLGNQSKNLQPFGGIGLIGLTVES